MHRMPLSAGELCDAMRQHRPFDPARLDRVLSVDEQRGLLEVQAATPWASIAAQLRPGDARASAVRTTMPTVGESIARNAAGPDGRPAVAHVQALTLVTPEGELRRLSREREGELFSLTVGGQGIFGACYSITLRIETLARAVEEATVPEHIVLGDGAQAPLALELLLPPERVQGFLTEADARCHDWRIGLHSAELRRTAAEDASFLRWACRDFVEMKLHFSTCDALGDRVRAVQLRRELIEVAIAAGGGFQIASTRDATREQAQACYPQLEAFLAHKRRFDPQEHLVNAWYLHQRRLLSAERCEIRWSS